MGPQGNGDGFSGAYGQVRHRQSAGNVFVLTDKADQCPGRHQQVRPRPTIGREQTRRQQAARHRIAHESPGSRRTAQVADHQGVAQVIARLDVAAVLILNSLLHLQDGHQGPDLDHGRLIAVAVIAIPVGRFIAQAFGVGNRLVHDQGPNDDLHAQTNASALSRRQIAKLHMDLLVRGIDAGAVAIGSIGQRQAIQGHGRRHIFAMVRHRIVDTDCRRVGLAGVLDGDGVLDLLTGISLAIAIGIKYLSRLDRLADGGALAHHEFHGPNWRRWGGICQCCREVADQATIGRIAADPRLEGDDSCFVGSGSKDAAGLAWPRDTQAANQRRLPRIIRDWGAVDGRRTGYVVATGGHRVDQLDASDRLPGRGNHVDLPGNCVAW